MQPKPTTSIFTNESGYNIFYRNWTAGGKPKGVVIIIHGLNSHSGYYQGFAEKLADAGYECYAPDLQGRGESEGERYYIADYRQVMADIGTLVQIVQCEHPGTPVILFGHSAGGVFASVYALHHQEQLDGLICESFAFHLPAPKLALSVMKLLGYIIPHTRIIKLKNADFSRESAFVDRLNSDPLLADEQQPTRTMQQLLLAGDHLKEKMALMHLPLLVLHGSADKATNPSGSRYFFDHASSPDKQLKIYEGYYHDLLNDRFGGIVIKDIVRWLNDRCFPRTQ